MNVKLKHTITMNIQVRKLNLIEHLLLLQDEKMLSKLEDFFESFQKKHDLSQLTPMSLEEFYARNRQSQKEIIEGKLIVQNEVKKHFEKKGR